MYRYLVFALLGGSFLIGGYYMREAGIERVFSYVESSDNEQLGVEDVTGKYLCDGTSGCKESYQITLYLNGAAKLSKQEPGAKPAVIERGTWQFIEGGLITLTLNKNNQASSTNQEQGSDAQDGEEKDIQTDSTTTQKNEKPEVLVAQSVSSSTLTKIIYNAKAYPFMHKPKFTKQDI